MAFHPLLSLGAEVSAALAAGEAVVALESTIITHGMPYPQNLETARAVESEVRAHGAVPATVAIMEGRLKAGLSGDELERLARDGHRAAKASRRDVAALIARRALAGTTVATTMQVAAMAGIRVFATGGIGGVHRGAAESFDISADLRELAETPVAVVCAGAKSILDIPKTLEVLESHGVPVIGYRTDRFPAFYVRDSGHAADYRLDTPEAVAEMLAVQFGLGMGGVLIGNPIPAEFELDAAQVEAWIAEALAAAEAAGIRGKETTPFLLKWLFEATGGRTLAANIELVRHNAEVAAEIAVALARAGRPR